MKINKKIRMIGFCFACFLTAKQSFSQEQKDTTAGHFIRIRCCFQDSATIKYSNDHLRLMDIKNSKTLFLATNQSIDADAKNFFYYPAKYDNAKFYLKIHKSNDSLLIFLPRSIINKYYEIFRDQHGLYYRASSKLDRLE